jgi:hypothetical protein
VTYKFFAKILYEDPKTYHKKLYSEPNPMEGEIKEDRNPGGRMEWTAIAWHSPKKINMLRGCFTSILKGLLKIFK